MIEIEEDRVSLIIPMTLLATLCCFASVYLAGLRAAGATELAWLWVFIPIWAAPALLIILCVGWMSVRVICRLARGCIGTIAFLREMGRKDKE